MAQPTQQQQEELKKAYLKLAKDLHGVQQTFIQRSQPVLEQLDKKTQQTIRDQINNSV